MSSDSFTESSVIATVTPDSSAELSTTVVTNRKVTQGLDLNSAKVSLFLALFPKNRNRLADRSAVNAHNNYINRWIAFCTINDADTPGGYTVGEYPAGETIFLIRLGSRYMTQLFAQVTSVNAPHTFAEQASNHVLSAHAIIVAVLLSFFPDLQADSVVHPYVEAHNNYLNRWIAFGSDNSSRPNGYSAGDYPIEETTPLVRFARYYTLRSFSSLEPEFNTVGYPATLSYLRMMCLREGLEGEPVPSGSGSVHE